MLRRQRIVLSLLAEAKRSLARPVVGQLVFLLRRETVFGKDPAGYDFAPFSGGPCSFTFEHELDNLKEAGFLSGDSGRLKLAFERLPESQRWIRTIPAAMCEAVACIVGDCGRMSRESVDGEVQRRYPEYSLSIPTDKKTERRPHAFFTVGYEGTSLENFLHELLREGIRIIGDVRANPHSRKFGFGRSTLADIAPRMGLKYVNFPELGIPRQARAKLDGFASYQRLLDSYERDLERRRRPNVAELAKTVHSEATVLMCKEQDFRVCHRSRLAASVAKLTGLPVRHLTIAPAESLAQPIG